MRGVYALLFILINSCQSKHIVHMDYMGCTKMAHVNPISRWILSETAGVPVKEQC
jgi:hypothetical protein